MKNLDKDSRAMQEKHYNITPPMNTPYEDLHKSVIKRVGKFGLPILDLGQLDSMHAQNHNHNIRNSSYFESLMYNIPPDVVSNWCTQKQMGVKEKKGERDVYTVVPARFAYSMTTDMAGVRRLSPQIVPLGALTRDMHTQVRGKICPTTVGKIVKAIKEGVPVAEPYYVYNSQNEEIYIGEGWHRTFAREEVARDAGDKDPVIAAYVVPGDKQFARHLGLLLNMEITQQPVARSMRQQAAADATAYYLSMIEKGTPVSLRSVAEAYSVYHFSIQERVRKLNDQQFAQFSGSAKDRIPERRISSSERDAAFFASFAARSGDLLELAKSVKKLGTAEVAPLLEVLDTFDRLRASGGN